MVFWNFYIHIYTLYIYKQKIKYMFILDKYNGQTGPEQVKVFIALLLIAVLTNKESTPGVIRQFRSIFADIKSLNLEMCYSK